MSEQDAPDEHEAAGEPAAGDDAETETPDPPADLVERVTEADPEAVARDLYALREEVDDLRERLDEREERVEELESSLKRTKADFQNYKKRQERRREQERRRATEDLVERLLDVRDNLARALDVEGDVREGVDSTLRQFDRVLDEEDVEAIDPAPGDEVDPQRHEVLMRVDADHPEGAIADVHRPGYEMGERVLRPAQVTVSEGTGGDGDSEDGEGGSEA
jgi:molecular chaperone GrpE